MNDAQLLVTKLRLSTKAWAETIEQTPNDVLNRAADNRWSPGQITMHLIMTEKGIVSVLTGPSARPDNNRQAAHERMERGLKDTARKLTSPKFLEPRAERYDNQTLIRRLHDTRGALEEILLNSPDLGNVFTSFPHPYFGLLTGYEWAHNVLLHADRHFAQFQNVLSISSLDNATP